MFHIEFLGERGQGAQSKSVVSKCQVGGATKNLSPAIDLFHTSVGTFLFRTCIFSDDTKSQIRYLRLVEPNRNRGPKMPDDRKKLPHSMFMCRQSILALCIMLGAWHQVLGDEVDQELGLQRAVAESLRGNHQSAVSMLDRTQAADTPALFSKALWALEKGDLETGIELLTAVRKRPDAPAATDKFLAIGFLHQGDSNAALRYSDAYLRNHQDDGFTLYLQGLALFDRKQYSDARSALRQAGYNEVEVQTIQQVVMQIPVDVNQRRSTIPNSRTAVLQRLPDRPDKNYNLTLLFAGEYDTNVPLQPRFTGLGSDIEHEDTRFVMASFLDVQLLVTDLFNLGLVGSTYNTFQFEENEFNIQDYMGGAYANALLTSDVVGALRYEFHHTLVDETRFADEHRLTPSLTWLGSRGHTTLFYEFNPIDSRAPALLPAQEQAAITNRLGITQAIYTFGGNGRIYAGYQYADSNADGDDFDRNSHMVTGRIERPLHHNMICDLDVRYFWDDYDNGNSLDFHGRPREDDRIEVRAGLQQNFSKPVSLRFDYTFTYNDSNTKNLFSVPFYEYERHVISTQLIFSL